MDRPESVDSGDKPAEEPARKRQKTDINMNSGICVATERYDRCWEEIVSYIPRLDDMFALIESCSYLQSMVDSFVRKANPDLTIDRCCLNRYPLDGYDHLYRQIGPLLTTWTVYKISDQKLERLGSYFKNIRNLHLKRILVLNINLAASFPNLLRLKVTECAIDTDTMAKFISAISSPLQFHLNMSTISEWISNIPWNNGEVMPKHLLPRLRKTDIWDPTAFTKYAVLQHSLTKFKYFTHVAFERMSTYWFITLDENIESLKIADCDGSITMSNIKGKERYLKLKCLSLETIASVRDFVGNVSDLGVDSSLEELALSHLFTPMDWLRGLKKLKKLKILLPIETYQEAALTEALAAMDNEIDVKYSVSPKSEDNQMQILNILNEDCLREIVTYLTLEDIFNLAHTHSRFKEIISSIDVSSIGISVWIDDEFLSRHPPNQQLIGYETLGQSLSKLTIKVPNDEITILAPCFPHLRNLKLVSDDICVGDTWKWTAQQLEMVPMLEALQIPDWGELSKDFLIKSVHKLQPTLRALYGPPDTPDFEYVQHLRNLKELQISCEVLNDDLREFWKLNQSLEVLHFESGHYTPPNNDINQERNWKEIGDLSNLLVLTVDGYEYHGPWPPLKHVKELKLVGFDMNMYKDFSNCLGNKLEVLILMFCNTPPDEIIALIAGFKNLRYFEYNIEDDVALSVKHVIQWIVELPTLSVIKVELAVKDFYSDFEDLQAFLSAAKRVLYFNGVKYPQRTTSRPGH